MGFFNPSTLVAKTKQLPTIAHCGRCGLHKQCLSPKMKVTGAGRRKVLFVAEAPGEEEDRQGTQLIGKAGQCLRRIMAPLRVSIDDCWKTNACICRPPNNVMDDVYIECCRPNLTNTIKELKPNVIVLLGASAVESLIKPDWNDSIEKIGRWVGWTIPSGKIGAWVCPTFHPSYVMRNNENPVLVRIVREHIQKALSLENRPLDYVSAKSLLEKVEVITDPRQGALRMKELAKKEGELAFDYETSGLKPERKEHRIWSCSFCLNGEDTFATRITEDNEAELSMVLMSKRLAKIGANIKFEDRWSRVKLGHPVMNWLWDDVLGAHLIDNREGICGVKFQSYVQLGMSDYGSADQFPTLRDFMQAPRPNDLNRIHLAPLKDELLYNGLDSIVEYMIGQRQRKELEII